MIILFEKSTRSQAESLNSLIPVSSSCFFFLSLVFDSSSSSGFIAISYSCQLPEPFSTTFFELNAYLNDCGVAFASMIMFS